MPAARDLTNVDILVADSNKKEQNIGSRVELHNDGARQGVKCRKLCPFIRQRAVN